jgi:hypothetical protein
MSTATTNGTTPVSERWEPESPFLSDVPAVAPGVTTTAQAPQSFAPMSEQYSPFIAEFAEEADAAGPRAERFAALVAELSDTEFSEVLEDLVNEATAVAEDRYRFSSEASDPASEQLEAEQAVRTYLEPVARTAEQMLEAMADNLSSVDLTSASENEIEALMEQFVVPAHDLSPVADQFLGGVLKKAKKLAAKITSVLPHNIILKKLAKLVRPLLERVLKSAINRLPVSLRPIANQLAKRFLGPALAGGPVSEAEGSEETASIDPVQLEEELDVELAGYIMDGEDYENEAAVERAVADELVPRFDQLRNLARKRKRFAKKIVEMKPDEPVEPVVEEFVPAVLAALKLGIKIIGRPKVVQTLSGFVANFIKKYVGPDQAKALSSALVSTGLQVIGLETTEETELEAAGYALGATVEDTIARLVQDAPETAWESEPVLHAYALEAFQQAASAHFPDALIRSELHESNRSSGAWVGQPQRGPHKTYKKYSRVIDINITPQAAAATRTFGGVPLRSFLADRLGVKVDGGGPLQARAHLFEAIPGTSLGLIALGEKQVPLLGSAGRAGRSLLHPLTPEAATALFGEPGLARPISPQFLERRGRIGVGQRFYFLEIPGARVRQSRSSPATRGTRPARSSQPKVVLDFPRRELRVFLFFSEADAQQLATLLRRKASPAAIISVVKTLHEKMLKRILATDPAGAVKIIHEAAPTENLAAPMVSGIVRTVGDKLAGKVRESLATVFSKELTQNYDRLASEFANAASDEADGVTMQITFQASPFLDQIRKAMKGGVTAIPGVIRAFARDAVGSYKLELRAGFGVR